MCRLIFQVVHFTLVSVFGIGHKAMDYKKKYHQDTSFHLNVKELLALIMIPVSNTVKAFNMIGNDFDDEANNFIDYFQEKYRYVIERGEAN